MDYELNGKIYKVNIIKKNNKNTYIRIKDDLTILVSTNFLITKKKIKSILDNNQKYLVKKIYEIEKQNAKKSKFYLLGKNYDIIISENNKVVVEGNKIYVKDIKTLEEWYKKEMINLYKSRVNYIYKKFEEKIPYPNIKIRKMKTRWGVCNRKTNTITLNADLMREEINKLDYVITHELSHFVHFNHSKMFWQTVEKYVPDYKNIRKSLKS